MVVAWIVARVAGDPGAFSLLSPATISVAAHLNRGRDSDALR